MNTTDEERIGIIDFFRSHQLMVLGTKGPDGNPQLAAVYVYIGPNGAYYFMTRNTTRKFQNIIANECVTLFAYDEVTMQCGEMTGKAHLILDAEKVIPMLTPLQQIATTRNTKCWMPPVGQIEGHNYVLFEVIPEVLSVYDYGECEGTDPKPRTYKCEEEFHF